MTQQSEPDDNLSSYMPGHAFVIVGRHPTGQVQRVCYHCGQEENLASRSCYANEEWSVIE